MWNPAECFWENLKAKRFEDKLHQKDCSGRPDLSTSNIMGSGDHSPIARNQYDPAGNLEALYIIILCTYRQ